MERLKKAIYLGIIFCLAAGFFGVNESAAVQYYSLGTASTAGVWYFLGAGFAAHVNKQYSDIKITAEITAGSGENYNLVKRGSIDFAMIHPNFGPDDILKGAIGKGPKCPFRQFLWSSTTNDFHWFTREGSPIKKLSDIKGRKFGIGPHGSGGTVKNLRVIKVLTGYQLGEDYDGIYLSYPDMIRGIQDDTIDLAAFFLAWPAPSLTNLSILTPIRFISLDDEEVAKVARGDPALMLMERVIPKGTYKGQSEDIRTLGQVQGILCTPSIPENDVYRIIKALFTNVSERNAIHPKAKGWTIDATVEMGQRQAAMGIPFHPGVRKYLMEIGKWSPKLEVK